MDGFIDIKEHAPESKPEEAPLSLEEAAIQFSSQMAAIRYHLVEGMMYESLWRQLISELSKKGECQRLISCGVLRSYLIATESLALEEIGHR